MSSPRPAIVTTTIFVPKALEAYMSNAVKHGHKNTLFVVTGDKKTPAETEPFLKSISEQYQVECIYMDCAAQDKWMDDHNLNELKEHLPWNVIQRRNVSLMVAYQQKCDPIITIDDDNYIIDGQDYIGDHLKSLAPPHEHTLLQSTTGWVNICDYLEEKHKFPFYARGYPMKQRWLEYPPITKAVRSTAQQVVNAGLWLDDPDLDAITRLCNSICATRYVREENFTLGRQTWSPFNSQNTAFARDVCEAYWLSPVVGRYDDIWAGYLINRIADQLGHEISYGFPLVKQERNPHNFFNDHKKEQDGLELTDQFTAWLRAATLTGTSYFDNFEQLIPQVKKMIEDTPQAQLRSDHREFLNGFIRSNEVFLATMRKLRS